MATSARPSEIRRLFRNCRIIGRRFKLAHIFYGDHIIETATFRAAPGDQPTDDDDLLIVDDNEYGTAHSDAKRRDFTVNALFLDPSSHEILDYVGGLADLDKRSLRTIGDPEVRLAEDPVRILRAVKFATRLDLEIDDTTWDAMCDVAPDLDKAAAPRVLEEIVALLFWLPYELDLERRADGDSPLDNRARLDAAWELLDNIAERTRLPKKDFTRARKALVAQQNFVSPPEHFSEVLFARSEEFVDAFLLFQLRSQARGVGLDIVEAWRDRAERARDAGSDQLDEERKKSRKRRRRRRNRGGRQGR